MSAPLAIDDVIQVVFKYVVASQVNLLVLHARVDTAGTSTTAEGSLNNIANFFADTAAAGSLQKALKECLAEGVYLDWVRAQKVKPFRTIYQQAEIDDFGAIAGATAPVNVACSIEKQSTHVGRKGVGRVQLGGLPAANVGSFIDPTFLSTEIAVLAGLLYGAPTIGTEPPLKIRWCLPAGGVDHSYDVWDAFPRPETRTMHRRTVGLGV